MFVNGKQTEDLDYKLLHEVSRHSIHVSETLEVVIEPLRGMLRQQEYVNALMHILQVLQALLARSRSNTVRLQNEQSLAFYTAAQRDSKVQLHIGKDAQVEALAMKAIAMVTITFLPAPFTFISAKASW